MKADLPLINIAEEDDSLIQQQHFPPDLDPTPSKSSLDYFKSSPFSLPPSNAKNLKECVRMEKPSSSSSEAISNKENINSNSVEVSKLGMEPMQMKRKKKAGGCNLRKSLAWDRAFFTDEGILNPLELTLVTGIDASTCRGGLTSISEEENSSFSSDVSCTGEPNDTEPSKETPIKEFHDKNRITKGNKEKTGSSMRNRDSLLHHEVTHKVLSSNSINRGRSKVTGFTEPLAASSLKRPAMSNTLRTTRKESKLPKLPIPKPGPCLNATTKGSMVGSQLRHNLIPKPTLNVEKNSGLKSSLQNAHGSQSKAKTGSGNLHLPVKELAQKTVKKLTHSSKAASSTRSQLLQPVQVDKANSQLAMYQDSLEVCKVLEESAPPAVKHLGQQAAVNSNNSSPQAARLTSLVSNHIQRASKGLTIPDRPHPRESQERLAALARPSGLRLPSPSLRLFDQITASESSCLQQKRNQQYMGSDKKIGEPWASARTPMKSNDNTENICCRVLTSSKEYCVPPTHLNPSPSYMLTRINGVTDLNIHQNLDIKLEYEFRDPEKEKRKSVQEEIAAAWKGDERIKASHPPEQLSGNVETCGQLKSASRAPETQYKSVLNNKEDVQSYTASSMSTSGKSTQHLEEKISTSTEKSDDAPPNISHLFDVDAGSQVFTESQQQDENRKCDDLVTTEFVAPDVENCHRSLLMEEGADVIELKGIDNSFIPFPNLSTEQSHDDADSVDAFHTTTTTTSPHARDPSAKEDNSPSISALPNSQLFVSCTMPAETSCLEEGTFLNATNTNDNLFHEKGVSSAILMDVPGEKQDGVDVGLTPREVAPLIDNPHQSNDLSHLRPQIEIISEIVSLGDDMIIKKESVLQGERCTNTYPHCLEKERMDTAPPIFQAQLKIPKENRKSQDSCGNMSEVPDEMPCLEEGTFLNATNTNDNLCHEKSVSSVILMDVPGEKQDKANVGLTPREFAPLIDDQHQSNGFSHLRPQVEILSETASLGDDMLIKKESVVQGEQCTNTYPHSLVKERMDIAAPIVEAHLKILKENCKSQDSCGNISEVKPAVHGSTGELEMYRQIQSENQTLEGSGAINKSETNLEDGQVRLSDGDVIVQCSSRLTSEVHNHSIENADQTGIHGKQAGFSSSGSKLERGSNSNEYLHQESVCKVVWDVVERSDVYECDLRPSNTITADASPPVAEEVGNMDGKLCVEYRFSASIVTKSPEHNESYRAQQSAEYADLTLTHDSELELELEPSVEEKMFVKNSTCLEYCLAEEKSCSNLTDSMLEENLTLFPEDRVLIKDSLISNDKNLDSFIVAPEENTNACAQILPMVLVNGDGHHQGSVSQELTTDVKATTTRELCCLVGGGDESLLTKTEFITGSESIGEQVDAALVVGEFQHQLDDLKEHKDVAESIKSSNSIKRKDSSLVILPPNAAPFSDEWLAAFEAAGEEILTLKCGAVQHSPPDKSLPEPSPWSPVKKKAIPLGPYDCTKHTNANSNLSDQ